MSNEELNIGLPEIMSLKPEELISWCRERKKALGISNAKLADMSDVPIGTIDRIMAGKYNEFRYSSIQPIIAVLIGFREETPEPETDDEQGEFYYNTIEGYKLIVENKNHTIAKLKEFCAQLGKEIEYIKSEDIKKYEAILEYRKQIEWLQKTVSDLVETNTALSKKGI